MTPSDESFIASMATTARVIAILAILVAQAVIPDPFALSRPSDEVAKGLFFPDHVPEMSPEQIGTNLSALNELRRVWLDKAHALAGDADIKDRLRVAQEAERFTKSTNYLLLGLLEHPEKMPHGRTITDVQEASRQIGVALAEATTDVAGIAEKARQSQLEKDRRNEEQRVAAERVRAADQQAAERVKAAEQQAAKNGQEMDNQRKALQNPVQYSGVIGRCQMLSHMPRGGYCLSVYSSCVAKALGDGVQIPIPVEPGYPNAYSPC